VLPADKEVPFEKVNRRGMITTGTVVVADPDAGLVPIMVNGNDVPPTTKLLLHMGILAVAAFMRAASSVVGAPVLGNTKKNGWPLTNLDVGWEILGC